MEGKNRLTTMKRMGNVDVVENPIGDMFDLADSLGAQASYAKKMTKWALGFMGFWAIFNLLIIIALSVEVARGNVGGMVVLVPLLGVFIAGMLAIKLVLHLQNFFEYFIKRHGVIMAAREGAEIVKVPGGRTAVDRYLSHLKGSSDALDRLLVERPKSIARGARLTGSDGKVHSFDAVVTRDGTGMGGRWGIGEIGYGLYIRSQRKLPSLNDIIRLRKDIASVSESTGIPPSRGVLVVSGIKAYDGLSDDVYAYLIHERFTVRVKGKEYHPNIQVVAETGEGTYDFVPMIPSIAGKLP